MSLKPRFDRTVTSFLSVLILGMISGTSASDSGDTGLDRERWTLSHSYASTVGAVFDIELLDERLLIAGGDGESGRIVLADDLRLSRIRSIADGEAAACSIDVDPSGMLLAGGFTDGTVVIVSLPDGDLIQSLDTESVGAFVVKFSPDGDHLVTGGSMIQHWSVKSWRRVGSIAAHEGSVHALEFSPDGERLASCGFDGTVRIWDIESRQSTETLAQLDWSVQALAFSDDGRLLAYGGDGSEVIVRDMTTGTSQTFGVHDPLGDVSCLAFSNDSQHLAIADGRRITVVPLNGEHTTSWRAHRNRVTDILFVDDEGTLLSGSWDRTIKVWECEKFQELQDE